MRFKNIILLILLAIITWPIMHSCKTKRQILSTSPISAKVSEDLFSDIIDNQFDFRTFSSRVNLNLSSGKKSISSKANLKILKDEAIQLSVQPLFGVEMLRLYINQSEIVLLDRMNKRYVKESISDLNDLYPIGFDFSTLQSLLTNRVFLSGSNCVEYSDFEKFTTDQISDQYYLIKSIDEKSGIAYSFAINGNDNVASTFLKEPKRDYELEWDYDEFVQGDNDVFPHKMNIILASPKRKANVGLEFSGIVLNDSFELEMTIPNGYSRAYISDIIKILTQS